MHSISSPSHPTLKSSGGISNGSGGAPDYPVANTDQHPPTNVAPTSSTDAPVGPLFRYGLSPFSPAGFTESQQTFIDQNRR